jgi:hypothetical protein
MKILVQDPRTNQFFKDAGSWTDDEKSAKTFPHTKSAVKFCLSHRMPGVHIVMKFRDGKCYTRLVIPENTESKALDRSGRFFVSRPLSRAA